MGVPSCCLHINNIVCKHFNRWLHVGSQNLLCAKFQIHFSNGFETLEFELNNNNNNNNNVIFVVQTKF